MLARAPDYAEGRNNRGLTLRELGRAEEALAEFDRVIAANPASCRRAWVNRASVLWRLERLDEALESYARALALDPDLPAALESRANLFWTRQPGAGARHRRSGTGAEGGAGPALCGGQPAATENACRRLAEFQPKTRRRLDEAVRAGKAAAQPFVYLALSESPADLLACARNYAAREFPALAPRMKQAARRPGPIRIGYVCGEFRAQATMYLAAGLFEHHDRSRFQVFGFDNGRDDGSVMRARVTSAFDKFMSIAALSDRDAAARIAAEEVDILVNLNGYFGRMRMGVFARSPAPIQVNYLGFPGSLGADYIDYILADGVVIPDGERRFYAEKLVSLPDSYQINDDKRWAVGTTTRAEHGLPENSFVFCHFNYGYKIWPDQFALWLRLLKQVQGSVLWLLAGDALFAQNLKAEAGRQGIDPQRLIFAPPLELAGASGAAGVWATCFSTVCLATPTPPPATRCGRDCRCSPAAARRSRDGSPPACFTRRACLNW